MCFYNSMSKKSKELAARYGKKSDIIEIIKEIIEEQNAIKAWANPDCAIITNDEEIQHFYWGLIPYWIKEKANEPLEKTVKTIRSMTHNAMCETVFEKPSYRKPILSKRCLIPSTGFFEYNHNEEKTTTLYKIILPEEEIFSIAGIHDSWVDPQTGEILNTFSLLTTKANPMMAEIHNGGKNPHRMPVIVPKERELEWLEPQLSVDNIKSFFNPFSEKDMEAFEVDKKTVA